MAEHEPPSGEVTDPEDAFLREAVHELVDTVEPFGVLTRQQLESRSHADRWRSVSFELALDSAVEQGVLRRLGGDLYEIPAASSDLTEPGTST